MRLHTKLLQSQLLPQGVPAPWPPTQWPPPQFPLAHWLFIPQPSPFAPLFTQF